MLVTVLVLFHSLLNSIKTGEHSLKLLLDGRLRLVLMKPHGEEPQGFSSQVYVSRLAPVSKLALGELGLVGVPPDLLEITMDLETHFIRDGVVVEPSSEGFPSRVCIEWILVGLDLQPLVSNVWNVTLVVATDLSSRVQLRIRSPGGSLKVFVELHHRKWTNCVPLHSSNRISSVG